MYKLFLFSLVSLFTSSAFGQEKQPQRGAITPKSELKATQTSPTPTQTISNSTTNTVEETADSYPQTYTVDVSGEQVLMDKAYYQQQLVNVNYLIQSIDSKVEYIKSSPEEDAQAKASGWYQQMENNRKDAEAKKVELAKKIESFN